MVDQAGQRAGRELEIGIEQEDVAAARVLHGAIDARGAAGVAGAAQQRGLVADELARAVSGGVVVDDDLVRDAVASRVDRAEAARDPALAVPRHDGDREGDAGVILSRRSAAKDPEICTGSFAVFAAQDDTCHCFCHSVSLSMSGRVTASHANRGAMRARFDTQRATRASSRSSRMMASATAPLSPGGTTSPSPSAATSSAANPSAVVMIGTSAATASKR